VQAREEAERVIDFLDLQHYRDTWSPVCPMACARWWSWRERWHRPKLLLLDEPSSGLNVEETDDMAFWIQDIKQRAGHHGADGRARHDPRLAVSDRVLAMNQGEVLAMGTPREVQSDPGVIEAYLGLGRGHVFPAPDLSPSCGSAPMSAATLLKLANVESAYGPIRAIRGVSLEVAKGEIATVLGQRRGQDDHPQDHLGHHRPAPRQHRIQGSAITAQDPSPLCSRACPTCPKGARCFRCCRCATT
jgi:ABC-type branched-subunit amino acid transport system ATPase component